MTKHFLTVDETAELLSVDVDTVYRMLRAGELPGIKLGGRRRSRWRINRLMLVKMLTPHVVD